MSAPDLASLSPGFCLMTHVLAVPYSSLVGHCTPCAHEWRSLDVDISALTNACIAQLACIIGCPHSPRLVRVWTGARLVDVDNDDRACASRVVPLPTAN